MAKKPTPFNFEKSLAELETLVETMENGEISLEDSLKHFERGISLTRACQKALEEADQKVKVLMEKDGQNSLTEFDQDEETD